MFSPHRQYLNVESGMHVIELRDGEKVHLVQISVGHHSCIACGRVHPKTNLDELDPKAMVTEVAEQLNASHAAMHAYAAKHGIQVK